VNPKESMIVIDVKIQATNHLGTQLCVETSLILENTKKRGFKVHDLNSFCKTTVYKPLEHVIDFMDKKLVEQGFKKPGEEFTNGVKIIKATLENLKSEETPLQEFVDEDMSQVNKK